MGIWCWCKVEPAISWRGVQIQRGTEVVQQCRTNHTIRIRNGDKVNPFEQLAKDHPVMLQIGKLLAFLLVRVGKRKGRFAPAQYTAGWNRTSLQW